MENTTILGWQLNISLFNQQLLPLFMHEHLKCDFTIFSLVLKFSLAIILNMNFDILFIFYILLSLFSRFSSVTLILSLNDLNLVY